MPEKFITARSIRALYSAYRLLPPFNHWHLPPAYEIKFSVTHDEDYAGGLDDDPLRMYISDARQSHLNTVTVTIMHEMVHLHLFRSGHKKWNEHGREFRSLAKQISAIYGFDPIEF